MDLSPFHAVYLVIASILTTTLPDLSKCRLVLGPIVPRLLAFSDNFCRFKLDHLVVVLASFFSCVDADTAFAMLSGAVNTATRRIDATAWRHDAPQLVANRKYFHVVEDAPFVMRKPREQNLLLLLRGSAGVLGFCMGRTKSWIAAPVHSPRSPVHLHLSAGWSGMPFPLSCDLQPSFGASSLIFPVV